MSVFFVAWLSKSVPDGARVYVTLWCTAESISPSCTCPTTTPTVWGLSSSMPRKSSSLALRSMVEPKGSRRIQFKKDQARCNGRCPHTLNPKDLPHTHTHTSLVEAIVATDGLANKKEHRFLLLGPGRQVNVHDVCAVNEHRFLSWRAKLPQADAMLLQAARPKTLMVLLAEPANHQLHARVLNKRRSTRILNAEAAPPAPRQKRQRCCNPSKHISLRDVRVGCQAQWEGLRPLMRS